MLRNFAAALIATALIAGPALAAPTSGTAGSTSGVTLTKPVVKHAKTVKHARKHHRHVVRHNITKGKLARHLKRKAPHHHIAHAVKPVKQDKNTRG